MQKNGFVLLCQQNEFFFSTSHSHKKKPALFFRIGQATLDKKELANLDFYVKNALEADREKVFTLCGSADKATGTAAGNQRLSEKRMEYVYKLLVEKYGVAKERLRKVAEGDRNNLFADPELNRAVIIR